MIRLNEQYSSMPENYLFSEIARRTAAYLADHPGRSVLRLGIGDVTLPLTEEVVKAMRCAAAEQGCKSSFHGYGPECGYDFLREAVVNHLARRRLSFSRDEIFITDGAAGVLFDLAGLFAPDNPVLVTEPAYPVYAEANRLQGREVVYLPAREENGFLPLPQTDTRGELIYLCSPSNPTGAAYTREQLQKWVDFANGRGAILLCDAAYEAFITDPACPHSIYEVPGARTCAIEIASLSKTAGFTGTRCGYTVVPHELARAGRSLNALWTRERCVHTNGVSYIIQRGAEAAFTEKGEKQLAANLAVYRQNARELGRMLEALRLWHCGGINSPYLWLRCPAGMTGWEFFDFLLKEAQIVGTPGEGFGEGGRGFFRLSSFAKPDDVKKAAVRFEACVRLLCG